VHFDSIVSGVQEVMKKNGDSAKKIWITEMGCPGVPVGENATTWFEGKALIEVDISSLKSFDNAITVKDLKVSDKVEIKAEAEEMVAMVQPPRDVEAELQDQTGDIANVEGLEKADETATAESEEKAEA
jgi:hypothetical protein